MPFDLRNHADQMLESVKVEYVDEAVLLVMAPADFAEGWQRYQIAADGAYGEEIKLPAPFGFPVPTGDWPRYPAGDTTSP